MDKENVISLTDRPMWYVKEKADKYCVHKLIEVDQDERQIRCRTCNAIVDPIDYIVSLATEEKNYFSHIRFLKEEIQRLLRKRATIT